MNIYERLLSVQSELKAPKGQYNSFGKYKYRSCEDILEAVKPLCKKYGLCLTLTDTIVQIGNRYYIKATAIITDGESKVETTAYAREDEIKKGMDGSQITGSASSYARKYALNGLFNIDDTKDADTDERTKATTNQSRQQSEPPQQYNASVICPKCGKPVTGMTTANGTIWQPKAILNKYGMCKNCYIAGKGNQRETN